jgi:hypothetical protein
MSEAAPAQASRRQKMLLGVLGIVLFVVVVYVLFPALFGGGAVRRTAERTRAAEVAKNEPASEVVDVHLERLAAPAVDPVEGGRNPFRMGAAPPAPGSGSDGPPKPVAPAEPVVPAGPPPPPPVPPIPFRFIGIVTGIGPSKMAVLSDGRIVVHGREGQIVDGRYRIVKIGEESIQIEHADGRGRQTIRLSGQ